MTSEPAKARPASVSVDVSPETGTRTVNLIEHPDRYVIVVASKSAPDSLIDAAARIAKGADQ